jgi:hypothetical protein
VDAQVGDRHDLPAQIDDAEDPCVRMGDARRALEGTNFLDLAQRDAVRFATKFEAEQLPGGGNGCCVCHLRSFDMA